jgi:hypothetical protein
MRIENWPIGIVSFTLEPGDFVRAKSAPFDKAAISPELLNLIAQPNSWFSPSPGPIAQMETQTGSAPTSDRSE